MKIGGLKVRSNSTDGRPLGRAFGPAKADDLCAMMKPCRRDDQRLQNLAASLNYQLVPQP